MRHRACGVVIREEQILLVRHVHNGRDYWTLPGGGNEEGESVFDAAVREVLEETGLHVDPISLICRYEASHSLSECVLMTTPEDHITPVLGHDPEEAHLPLNERMLQEVAWRRLDQHRETPMIQWVMSSLDANHGAHQ